MMELGILWLIGFILWIWAAIHIVQSHASPIGKAVWLVLILALPVLGFIIWFFLGPRSASR